MLSRTAGSTAPRADALVIFGITGDLARVMTLRSLYRLERRGELDVPVGLAFFLRSSQRGQVCGFYPSPAGATECTLDLQAWARLGESHPLVSSAEEEVEAVLVSRADAGVEHFLVPIDACYELAGRIRLLWQGFDGGAEARQAIEEFLGSVRARARDLVPET